MADTPQQPIVMNMPKELIDAHIRTLVLDACLKNGDALLRAVVDAVLLQKTNHYDGETVMDKLIGKLIQETAQLAAQEWIKEQAPRIRDAVRKRMDSEKSSLVKKLCDQMGDRLVNGISVDVHLGDR